MIKRLELKNIALIEHAIIDFEKEQDLLEKVSAELPEYFKQVLDKLERMD